MTEIHRANRRFIEPACGWRYIYIQANFVEDFDAEDVYWEDWAAPGHYEVMVPADMDDETAASCAMGAFHDNVPIKRLDMFEYTVYDENGLYELDPYVHRDWYELGKRSGKFHCCGKDYQKEAAAAAGD